MIRVPEALPDALAQAPASRELSTPYAAGIAERSKLFRGIDPAPGTHALVAKEDLLAQIGRL